MWRVGEASKEKRDATPQGLIRPRLSGPTKEGNPRCELTAFSMIDGVKKRVHVFTLTQKKTKHFENVCQTAFDKIIAGNGSVTKAEMIMLRDSMIG